MYEPVSSVVIDRHLYNLYLKLFYQLHAEFFGVEFHVSLFDDRIEHAIISAFQIETSDLD